MDDLNLKEVITNFAGGFHCVTRRGFVFSSVTGPANVFDGIVIRNPENCDCWSPKMSFSRNTLEQHIDFINHYGIEKAVVIAEDISFISRCPSLKYLEIIPADTAPENFDYSPIYTLPEVRYLFCRTAYGGSTEHKSTTVDYSRITGLLEANVSGQGHLNYNHNIALEYLDLSYDKTHVDFRELSCSEQLKKIWLLKCNVESLSGIERFRDLQNLSLDYCHRLHDISNLACVADSLRSLSIERCPNIADFSCLSSLVNLEALYLHGKNELPSLDFLNKMQSLKVFTFSMGVLDCDLSPCLRIPYASSSKSKKQYNLKDKDLPKRLPTEPFRFK